MTPFSALRRTTTFRLTALYGLLFALGTVALLGMVYLRSVGFLTERVDNILNTEADALVHLPRPGLQEQLDREVAINGSRLETFGLFEADGTHLNGNIMAIPKGLQPDGRPLEVTPPSAVPFSARLIARRLAGGQILVVGRDVNQLREMRAVITSALVWSGACIVLIGLLLSVLLGIAPMRRLRRLQAVAQDIARGDLKQRMPITSGGDELDMFAATVNFMIGEVERLMSEVKGATEVIAHDLLSPLANAALQLRRIQRSGSCEPQDIDRVAARIEDVLDRFRAILRITELDARQRRSGFSTVDLAEVIEPAADLYQPLAEAAGVRLLTMADHGSTVQADPKLLLEAVSNLLDNAIKFAGKGGTVQVRVGPDPACPRIIVEDDGPGIPAAERGAVLQRFYRSERTRLVSGSGLGLSIVAAIIRLHDFELQITDADPGVRAIISCCPSRRPE